MFGSIFNQKKKEDEANPQENQPGASVNPQDPNAPQSAAPVQDPNQIQGGQPGQDPNASTAGPSNPYGTTAAPGTTSGVTDASGQPVAGQPGQADTSSNPVASQTDASNQPVTGQPGQTDQAAAGQPSQPGQPNPNAAPGTPVAAAGTNGTSSAARADMSSLSHLDPRATQVLTHAQEEARRIKQQFIEPDQILFGLLYDEQIFKLIGEFQVDGGVISKEIQAREKMGTYKGQPTLSKTSQTIFDQAYRDAKMRGSNFISPEDIYIVLFSPNLPTAEYLTKKGMKKEAVIDKIGKNPTSNYGRKTVLEKYGIDLTEEARAGRLDPVAGRDKEVDRIVHILLRRTKNNPIIIGETGVGKTAIVEGLAQQIVAGKVPKDLTDKRIFQLDVASMVAGASHRGEFEERLRGIINEVLGSNNKIVLFIDEIHTLMGTGEGEGVSAANIIKPHLARGHFQLIGATTTTEYRKNFEKDKAFERRFQPVTAEEPSDENAVEMLKVLRPKYEKFHRITIPDDALKECVKLSKKYIGERFLPDKAIDLLDEAASHVKLQADAGKRGDNQVKKTDIEQIVSAWTGIPITKLTEDESEKLLKLEDRIHKRMVDQEPAVISVSEAVRRGRIGLASGQRPIASFIFLGPTGVGKTELAKTLAELLFGKDDAMARLDMSEFMEKHEVAKLIGAPPGYVGYEEGGVLTEAVRKKPYSIVLFDEIEKAHPDVFNILLQLLEDGRLTDNKGNTISFKNTIVICTSNIGSNLIQQQLSAIDKDAKQTAEQMEKQFKDLQKLIREELTKFLRPEVLNRFDEVVIFKPLRPEHMAGIVRFEIAKTAKLLKEQGYNLQITEKAVMRLAKDGYDPVYGARPLRRLIQTVIENPIALAIISKKFAPGDTIVIDFNDDVNEFMFLKGGQTQTEKDLSDEKFRIILQRIAKPESALGDAEKGIYTALHDKVVSASTGNNKTATAILSVTGTTSVDEIKRIRTELEEAKVKGDALAEEILALAGTVAQKEFAATNLKKVFLELINPELVKDAEKKEHFVAVHDRLKEAADQQVALAVAVMGITDATSSEALDKIMDDLRKSKDNEDELATEILSLVNTEITEEAKEAQEAEPTTKFRNVLKQVINPLYGATPENKEKFTQLYDKISAAGQQNHPLASSILTITDMTSDSDIQQLEDQLKLAKKQGDPLAAEIVDAIEAAIKYEGVSQLKNILLQIVNPITAKTPAERDNFTQLQTKVSGASQRGDQLAIAIMGITDATTQDDMLKLKDQIAKAVEEKNELAVVIADVVDGTPVDAAVQKASGTPVDAAAQQAPDPNYPFGKAQSDNGTPTPTLEGAAPAAPTDPSAQVGVPTVDPNAVQPGVPPTTGAAMAIPTAASAPGMVQPGYAAAPQAPVAPAPSAYVPQNFAVPTQPVAPAAPGMIAPAQPMMPPAQPPPPAGGTGAMAGAAFENAQANQSFPPVMNENMSNGIGATGPSLDPKEHS